MSTRTRERRGPSATTSSVRTPRPGSIGTAPAGAVKARLLFEFKQPAMAAGSVFFDDVSFGKVVCPVCPADYNQDGGVDGSDVGAFYADWESGDASADVNQDGGVDGADVQVFFTAWERGSC